MNIESVTASSSLDRAYPLVVLLGFFLITSIIRGVSEHCRRERKFWARPTELVILWSLSGAIMGLMFVAINYMEYYDTLPTKGFLNTVVVLASVFVTVGGILSLVGTIGCSLVVPFISSRECLPFGFGRFERY